MVRIWVLKSSGGQDGKGVAPRIDVSQQLVEARTVVERARRRDWTLPFIKDPTGRKVYADLIAIAGLRDIAEAIVLRRENWLLVLSRGKGDEKVADALKMLEASGVAARTIAETSCCSLIRIDGYRPRVTSHGWERFKWYLALAADHAKLSSAVRMLEEHGAGSAPDVELAQTVQFFRASVRSFEQVSRQVAKSNEVADLLIDVSQTGLAAGLDFRLFQPGSVEKRGAVSFLPTRIEVEGTAEQVLEFVDGVGQLPRMAAVDTATIPVCGSNQPVKAVLTVHILLEVDLAEMEGYQGDEQVPARQPLEDWEILRQGGTEKLCHGPNRGIEKHSDWATSRTKPDVGRRREELEQYSLRQLTFEGTLDDGRELRALIRAPRGVIHRLGRGNYAGRDHGIVLNITDSRIDVAELVEERPGVWANRSVSIERSR